MWIEKFIDSLNGEYDTIVFIGDYFDKFGSTKDSATRTCEWLKFSVNEPHRIHLWGNHDLWYAYPLAEGLLCSGNSIDKQKMISQILFQRDWDKLTLFTKCQNWYLSHAGLHQRHFEHPVLGMNDNHIQHLCDQAIEEAKFGRTHDILKAGWSRGGSQSTGGLTWLDWSEMKPIHGFNQIVGHSQGSTIKYNYVPNKKCATGTSICIDCNCRYIGKLVDGKFDVIDNPILGSW